MNYLFWLGSFTSAGAYWMYQRYQRPVSVGGADNPLKEPVLIQRAPNGHYHLDLLSFFQHQPLQIEAIPFSEGLPRMQIEAQTQRLRLDHLPRQHRFLFQIEGRAVLASERLIPLAKTSNFRDLGGLPTQDGRSLKWGLLYRSDRLSGLGPGDWPYFKNLRIQTICDFRGPDEVSRQPNRLPPHLAFRQIGLPIYDPNRPMGDFLPS
ncbi:MAG: tyrosine-protein phosphatase [Microscillaceae bacterium]|nr:tyrosine-protein phosphatase [Microscillaceae bacterium]